MKLFLYIISILFISYNIKASNPTVIAAGEIDKIEITGEIQKVDVFLWTWWLGTGYLEQTFECASAVPFNVDESYLFYLSETDGTLVLDEAIPVLAAQNRFESLGDLPPRRYETEVGLWGYIVGDSIWTPWFGVWKYYDEYNLTYHSQHGWLHRAPEPIQRADFDAWFWDFSKGDWLYTGFGIYPFMFSAAEWDWLYYFEGGTPEQRWFYSFKNEAFESVVIE